jgi:hypothetical protein
VIEVTPFRVLLFVFVVILATSIGAALKTGVAYHGGLNRYVERSRSPVGFWIVVVFLIMVCGLATWALAEQVPPELTSRYFGSEQYGNKS